MSTLNTLQEGLHEAWDTLLDGWQRLYSRAAGAITRFTPGGKDRDETSGSKSKELYVRNTGWGVLAAEVFDDNDKVVVRLETPGLDKEDFDLHVENDSLIVRGEKRMERERTHGRYHISQCAYGNFQRVIPLPDEIESSKASASYRNGVLRVELPKSASRQSRIIKVKVK